ncbi:MAG TPA: SAM-dependent methyltransferase [Gallionellaceae bacterium]|nr:SAM-dependent methyltransferase [Gallionellaceae bacterium]
MASLPSPGPDALAHSESLRRLILEDIVRQEGWIPFSRYMELALYAPGLGYYAAGARKFGAEGDFVTAPEISPLFGRVVARQAVEIMALSTPLITELGAGSGKLAVDILLELERLGSLPDRYCILDLSAELRERQRALLQARAPHLLDRVAWLDTLPDTLDGVVLGNEVLDAMPVHLVRWGEDDIYERGVAAEGQSFAWHDRPVQTPGLLEAARLIRVPEGYQSEISLSARGLARSLSERLRRGVALFVDYGFGAGEYYHPQRSRGTLMCHYRHHVHDDPFFLVGLQDITSHVDFTAIMDSAAEGGAHLLGYTTQAHFLMNAGIVDLLRETSPENARSYLPLSSQLQKLTSPAEMGELFKVIALGKGVEAPLSGFARGDLSRLL